MLMTLLRADIGSSMAMSGFVIGVFVAGQRRMACHLLFIIQIQMADRIGKIVLRLRDNWRL